MEWRLTLISGAFIQSSAGTFAGERWVAVPRDDEAKEMCTRVHQTEGYTGIIPFGLEDMSFQVPAVVLNAGTLDEAAQEAYALESRLAAIPV